MNTTEFLKERNVISETVQTWNGNDFGTINLSELLEEFATGEKKESFKTSDRAKQLAELLNDQFGLHLFPAVKRRYRNNEKIKFEMKDSNTAQIYYFHGLVQDFLSNNAVIKNKQGNIILEDF